MLGVQKTTRPTQAKISFFAKYLLDFPKLFFQIIKISISFIFMKRLINKFNREFDEIYNKIDLENLDKLSSLELKNLYEQLVSALIEKFRIPIANDFAVMISTGITDKLFKKNIDKNGVFSYLKLHHNQALISLDPGKSLEKMAQKIAKNSEILELFKNNNDQEIWKNLANSKIKQEIENYLKKFGSRSPNELKLESLSLSDSPEQCIQLLKHFLKKDSKPISNIIHHQNSKKIHLNNSKFSFKIKWLLSWTQNSIARREETRFRRALIFGVARKIFVTLGKKLAQQKIIENSRDIFYLKTSEIWELIDLKSQKLAKKNLNKFTKIITDRKNSMKIWEKIELPRRIESPQKITAIETEFLKNKKNSRGIDSSYPKTKFKNTKSLKGMVTSNPVEKISGEILVLAEFDAKADFENKILVTKQTDPGWTIIFPVLKGLIVERGGMLSHAAIVARELGIPCIIGVENATKILKNKENIEMNLKTGEIKNI